MRKVIDPKAVTINGVFAVFGNWHSDVGWDIAFTSHQDPRNEESEHFDKLKQLVKDLGDHNVVVRYYYVKEGWLSKPFYISSLTNDVTPLDKPEKGSPMKLTTTLDKPLKMSVTGFEEDVWREERILIVIRAHPNTLIGSYTPAPSDAGTWAVEKWLKECVLPHLGGYDVIVINQDGGQPHDKALLRSIRWTY